MIVRRGKRPIRRGAAMVEAAIILPVFLTLCLGMIDLGMAVFQNNAVAEASRQGARIASVHGSLAPNDGSGTTWGPTSYNAWSGAGNSSNAIPDRHPQFRCAGGPQSCERDDLGPVADRRQQCAEWRHRAGPGKYQVVAGHLLRLRE